MSSYQKCPVAMCKFVWIDEDLVIALLTVINFAAQCKQKRDEQNDANVEL